MGLVAVPTQGLLKEHQFDGLTVAEKMNIGTLTMSVPAAFCRLVLPSRQRQSSEWHQWVQQAVGLYDSVGQDVLDSDNRTLHSEIHTLDVSAANQHISSQAAELAETWEEHLQLLTSTAFSQVSGACTTFKPSRLRKQKDLAMLPTNLQWYKAFVTDQTSDLEKLFTCVTVGAPAAHTLGFGGSRYTAPPKAGTLITDQLDSQSHELLHLQAHDHCRSQALTAVASAATQ